MADTVDVSSIGGREQRSTQGRKARATKELLLDTAERLFAENGIYAVSNRQIADAAGQGNPAVVGYYYDSRLDLVRALVERFNLRIEPAREAMLDKMNHDTRLRQWIECQVFVITQRFAELGTSSCFARFCAHLISAPELRSILLHESLVASPSSLLTYQGLVESLPYLPVELRTERAECAFFVTVGMCANFERALASGAPGTRADWDDFAVGLVDVLVGIWTAPVTPG
ncbi:TetR family transcriptional regulator [Gordonia sp. SID5947]|uniref:TetR/AcrR family transcriptional regulator n=1 Tax=Gordonia sp. SID5947 TaxID=2690315 RepID=UPI0013691D14|nr:TetR/AcrR family transcriptional regulator [Gordonia sp. SID5947]MYR05525.1 TetR family transcriptional regulator [Gordonia sp. SID5947]